MSSDYNLHLWRGRDSWQAKWHWRLPSLRLMMMECWLIPNKGRARVWSDPVNPLPNSSNSVKYQETARWEFYIKYETFWTPNWYFSVIFPSKYYFSNGHCHSHVTCQTHSDSKQVSDQTVKVCVDEEASDKQSHCFCRFLIWIVIHFYDLFVIVNVSKSL